jgi:hypothetical protein
VTVLLLRTATDRGTYHYAEVIHERGRWVPLDAGYIDFDHPKQYRELWIGGGFKPIATARGSLTVEGLIDKASGAQSGGALYLQPFFLGTARVVGNVLAEAEYFGYVPLNDEGHAQHVIERAKVEYDFPRFKVGGGYAAYSPGDGVWNHKPYITTTLKVPRVGNIETWFQRLSGGYFSVQFRYSKVFVH